MLQERSLDGEGFLDGPGSWLLGIRASLIYLTSPFFFYGFSFSCSVSLPSLGAICLFELKGNWIHSSFLPKSFLNSDVGWKSRPLKFPTWWNYFSLLGPATILSLGKAWAKQLGAEILLPQTSLLGPVRLAPRDDQEHGASVIPRSVRPRGPSTLPN